MNHIERRRELEFQYNRAQQISKGGKLATAGCAVITVGCAAGTEAISRISGVSPWTVAIGAALTAAEAGWTAFVGLEAVSDRQTENAFHTALLTDDLLNGVEVEPYPYEAQDMS